MAFPIVPITEGGMIPIDGRFPGHFLKTLIRQNDQHSREAPIAVILLSLHNDEAQHTLSNYHLIEQISKTHKVYLRDADSVSEIPQAIKHASELTGRGIRLVMLNGHVSGGRSLRVGRDFLNARNAGILNCPELEPDARFLLKGCRMLTGASQWRWPLGRTMSIEASSETTSSFRTFFHNGRFLAYSIDGCQEAGIVTESGVVKPSVEEGVFIECLKERGAYLEAHATTSDAAHVGSCYIYLAKQIRKLGENQRANALFEKALKTLLVKHFEKGSLPAESSDIFKTCSERWTLMTPDEQKELIESIIRLEFSEMLIYLLDHVPKRDFNYQLGEAFLISCMHNSTVMCDVIASHPEFAKLPKCIPDPRTNKEGPLWFGRSYLAVSNPAIFKHFSAHPLGAELDPGALMLHLDSSSSARTIRAIREFPQSKNLSMDDFTRLYLEIEREGSSAQLAALREWPQFEQYALIRQSNS